MLSRTLQTQQPPAAEQKEKPLAVHQQAEWEVSEVIWHGKGACALQNAPHSLSAVLCLAKGMSSVLEACGRLLLYKDYSYSNQSNQAHLHTDLSGE